MPVRRSSLWVEVALALAVITLTTILLNASVFWLILKRAEEERRTDLAEALVAGLVAQLEASGTGTGPRPIDILRAYGDSQLSLDELFVMDQSAAVLHSVKGRPPDTPDSSLRAALFGRESSTQLDGVLWGKRSVAVTAPVVLRGERPAALRVRIPLATPVAFGGPASFVLAYTGTTGVLLAIFGFVLLRQRLILPIAEIRRGTDRIAGGEFGHSVSIEGSNELEALCASLNAMSAELALYRGRTADQLAEVRRANDELRATQHALIRSERLAGVGRLAAGVAHELGNPLAAVLGFVELLAQGLGDPALEADLLARSRVELERMHRIIRDLLHDSRNRAAETELVDVSRAIFSAFDSVRHLARFREIALHCSHLPKDDKIVVSMEAGRLHQVLVNVLLNAADAIGPTRGSVSVSVNASPTDVVLTVVDSGPGFSEMALERALEPFFTTKEPGAGTGLGLPTSNQMLQSAGGCLEIGNDSSGGGFVRICLPTSVGDG